MVAMAEREKAKSRGIGVWQIALKIARMGCTARRGGKG
jgi:hypothetical protein